MKYAPQRFDPAAAIEILRPHPRNPRRGEVGLIAELIAENGFYGAIVAQESTGYILAGNHRYKAAVESGAAAVPAFFLDVDDATAIQILLGDNRASDQATNDAAMLAQLLGEIRARAGSLNGTGYDAKAFQELLTEANGEPTEGETDPDDAPQLKAAAEPVSRVGDIWILGQHRLMCGDATDPGHVRALLGRDLVDLVFTDPPYGVDFISTKKPRGYIAGDDLRGGELADLVRTAIQYAKSHSKPGRGAYYVCLSWRSHSEFLSALRAVGLEPKACIVWNKKGIGLGKSHYRPQHELILYCRDNPWVIGLAGYDYAPDHEFMLYIPGGFWSGGHAESDVWDLSRGNIWEYVHPTQKPVELVERAIRNSSLADDLIYDPFGGSGSTLIAAERTGRRARLMELDPKYVDVIVERWEKFTGRQAERVSGSPDEPSANLQQNAANSPPPASRSPRGKYKQRR